MRLCPQDKFKNLFPKAARVYTYDGFIQAVAAFPKFCGEKGTTQQAKVLTIDQVCIKEIITLFSHITWQTSVRDINFSVIQQW